MSSNTVTVLLTAIPISYLIFFFFNDTATTEIYTLSLHDALPISTREVTREVGDIPDLRDRRVRSLVLMAPNAARFTDDALAKVGVPVRVYAAENDDLTRVRYHAERLARVLPQAECVVVKGAGHFSFVASFPPALKIVAGEGARDPDGFDRDAFHEVMNREIVEFFNRTLRPAGNTPIRGA